MTQPQMQFTPINDVKLRKIIEYRTICCVKFTKNNKIYQIMRITFISIN